MPYKRSTAITLATAAITLGASGSAIAMPAGPDPVSGDGSAPLVVATPGAPIGDDGLGTLAVVLLSSGALVAGAAAGFGGARASMHRTPLHQR